jgi:hypothetical protein
MVVAVIATGYFSEIGKKIASDGEKQINKEIPQKVLQRLLKNLEEKDVAIDKRDAKLEELTEKYKELEKRLANRSHEDELAALAKQKLNAGDLEGAESLLRHSLKKNLQNKVKKEKAAASNAFELGFIKELQLDYDGAKQFYEETV